MLNGKEIDLKEYTALVENYIIDIFNKINRTFDMNNKEILFIGGGSLELKKYIEKYEKIYNVTILKNADMLNAFSNYNYCVETLNEVEDESKNGLDFGNNLLKPKGTYVGTNHFSGGITAINEKGDELIMGPSGMIVANNPSTMNIMSKLSNLESQTSQMRFRMGESQGSVNNITLNIGSVRSDDDIAEIKRTLENLALS